MPDAPAPVPRKLDLKRDERLRIEWSDGTESTHSVALLRQLCPCALCKMARDGTDPHQLMRPATPAQRPQDTKPKKRSMKLSILPSALATEATVTVERAELVGNYAIKLHFSDGHDKGIYSWQYLREIDK